MKLCDARNEDVESIPGFVDITVAFNAGEVDGTRCSSDNDAVQFD
jgi:hypothetical protein